MSSNGCPNCGKGVPALVMEDDKKFVYRCSNCGHMVVEKKE